MSRLTELLLCLLLCWMCSADTSDKIDVKPSPKGYILSCPKDYKIDKNDNKELKYQDKNTGVYTCNKTDELGTDHQIFVKFRTCDNCIDMDATAVASIVAGNVVATVLIGVAVYFIASQPGPGPVANNKKRSDRQPLVANENIANSSTYQELQKNRQRDEYGVLKR